MPETETDTRPEMTDELWRMIADAHFIGKGDVKHFAIMTVPRVHHTRWTSRARDHYIIAPNGQGRFGMGARDYQMMRSLTAQPLTHKEAYSLLAALQRWAGIPPLTQAEMREDWKRTPLDRKDD